MSMFNERRRVAPRERFAGAEKQFNLEREFEQLPNDSTIRQGHMQKALYRHGPVTTGIFEFEANGGINQHRLDGESIIHVLQGELFVRTDDREYTLGPSEILLLDPNVSHDLRAVKPTRLLMTVVLTNAD